MKKLIWSALTLAIMAGTLFTSCDETDTEEKSDVIENLEDGILNGNLEEDYTLDA